LAAPPNPNTNLTLTKTALILFFFCRPYFERKNKNN
jgi:hypothetical protein